MPAVLLLCVVSYLITDSYTAVAPFIKPCKLYERDNECLRQSAQAALAHMSAGLPDLGVPALDPLILADQKIGESNLKLKFKNFTIVGLEKCKFNRIKFPSNASLTFVAECPIKATGIYNIKGNLFILPIEGAGEFAIKTEKVKISMTPHFDLVDGADGKKHWHITSMERSYSPIEPVRFNFKNLFNGDEEKSKPITNALNNNWREMLIFIDPVIDNIFNKVQDVIEKLFSAVPAEELYVM